MSARPSARTAAVLTAAVLTAVAACTAAPVTPGPTLTPPLTTTTHSEGNATVSRVYDGDTLFITTDVPGEETGVRVLGINAPELRPGTGACYGIQAADEVKELLPPGTRITLTADPAQGDKDRYARLLRYVTTPAGQDLARLLLEQGYARVYTQYPVARTPQYLQDEREAAAADAGGFAAAADGGCGWTL